MNTSSLLNNYDDDVIDDSELDWDRERELGWWEREPGPGLELEWERELGQGTGREWEPGLELERERELGRGTGWEREPGPGLELEREWE